jgi:hypothetical protein
MGVCGTRELICISPHLYLFIRGEFVYNVLEVLFCNGSVKKNDMLLMSLCHMSVLFGLKEHS